VIASEVPEGPVLASVDAVILGPSLTGETARIHCCGVQRRRPGLPVIICGDLAAPEDLIEAMQSGLVQMVPYNAGGLCVLPAIVLRSTIHRHVREQNDELRHHLNRARSRLRTQSAEFKSVIGQLESLARIDELTGLYNRRWLNLTLEGAWAEAARGSLPLSFLMIDLDGLKRINDQLGHQAGDDLLRLTSRVIEANSRSVDIAARYGGDEFCILMPNTDAAAACDVAERLQDQFIEAVASLEHFAKVGVGVSVGVANNVLSRPSSPSQLVGHADQAMYAAKASGSNQLMIKSDEGHVCSVDAAREPSARLDGCRRIA
jgi:diguanylate cyclase (GGDEF)-like protein